MDSEKQSEEAQQPVKEDSVQVEEFNAAPSATPPEPAAQAVVQVASKSKKGLFAGVAVGAGVLALGAAFYFLQYLPNTPANVYRRGMASVGVGLAEVADDGMAKLLQNTNITGSMDLEMTSPESTDFYTGEVVPASTTTITADVDGNYSLEGEGAMNLAVTWEDYSPSIETRYSISGGDFPSLYFKFDGIKEVVDSFFDEGAFDSVTGGNEVENIWWLLDYGQLVDRGLVTQGELEEALASGEKQLSQEDTQKLFKAFVDASSEYMFTSETDKMVLQQKESLGVDAYDGVESEKYLVELNKANLEAYLKAIRDNMDETGVFKKLGVEKALSEEITDQEISDMVKELDVSNLKIEIWVNKETKILRNIRFTPTDEGGDVYVDVSLLLEGDSLDKIPLRLKVVGDDEEAKGEISVGLVVDFAGNKTALDVSANMDYSDEYSSDIKMDMNLEMVGTPEAPALEIPEDSQSFIDFLFDDLGFGESL